MRWFCVLLFLLATACDKQGAAPATPKSGGPSAAPKAQPSADPAKKDGEEGIVPPPDKPGYAKPE